MRYFWQPAVVEVADTSHIDLDPVDTSYDACSMEQSPPYTDPDGDELADEGTPERRCQQAEIDIRCDEARRGERWPDAERRLLVEQRIRQLEDLDRWVEASVELHRLQLEVAFQDRRLAATRHQELVDTVERGNVVAKVGDFAMAHPFLTGFFGASLLGKFRKR